MNDKNTIYVTVPPSPQPTEFIDYFDAELTTGYYSFGIYNINPPQFTISDPVLVRYSGKFTISNPVLVRYSGKFTDNDPVFVRYSGK